MKKYLISISVLTLLLVIINHYGSGVGLNLHETFGSMLIFFTAQSVIIAGVLWLAEKKGEYYGLIGLGIVVLRLITAILFLIVMYVQGVDQAMQFVVQFMLLYLSYLVFELTVVLANLRRN